MKGRWCSIKEYRLAPRTVFWCAWSHTRRCYIDWLDVLTVDLERLSGVGSRAVSKEPEYRGDGSRSWAVFQLTRHPAVSRVLLVLVWRCADRWRGIAPSRLGSR